MEQYFTAEDLEKLKKELVYLKTVKTREIAELIKHTASFGDLRENAAYHDAKEKQAFLQGRILELEAALRNAKVVDKKLSDKIQVGSIVTISSNGKKEKVKIVGPGQADFSRGKISYQSPLGQGLVGKSKGDTIKIAIEEGDIIYKIVKIE